VLCSSPNSVVVDRAVDAEVRRQFQSQGGHFLSPAEADRLAKVLVTPQRLPNPALVGKPATQIADAIGVRVPPGTRALLAELDGVGRDYPLSIEKLCPVLSYYVVSDWREGCERCKQILRYGGMGHTMSIHSRNESIILEFGLHKPAYRICVNTPSTLGAIGLTTGLDPAMTLGCGGFGGNITSDNISPRHLLNIKRLAYEIRPARQSAKSVETASSASGAGAKSVQGAGVQDADTRRLPQAPAKPAPEPIAADALTRRIDAFLASRGIAASGSASARSDSGASIAPHPARSGNSSEPRQNVPVTFVCEDDVRAAVRSGEKILVGEKTIITPAARDAGEAAHVFTWQSFPR